MGSILFIGGLGLWPFIGGLGLWPGRMQTVVERIRVSRPTHLIGAHNPSTSSAMLSLLRSTSGHLLTGSGERAYGIG